MAWVDSARPLGGGFQSSASPQNQLVRLDLYLLIYCKLSLYVLIKRRRWTSSFNKEFWW